MSGDTKLTLPGLADGGARLLAAEALGLLLAQYRDMNASSKRMRIREPLMLGAEPPGLPITFSADLQYGDLVGGQALISAPLGHLRAFVRVLQTYFELGAGDREAVWGDPWVFRDFVDGASPGDPRIAALLCVAVHPGSFTGLLRPDDRSAVAQAFADRIGDVTEDVDRNLRQVVLALQVENGGHAVDLWAPP